MLGDMESVLLQLQQWDGVMANPGEWKNALLGPSDYCRLCGAKLIECEGGAECDGGAGHTHDGVCGSCSGGGAGAGAGSGFGMGLGLGGPGRGAEIEEAQALREEAQKTLAEYKRKQRDALKEAEAILDHAKVEAKRHGEQAERDLEAALERREQAAVEKIAQAEAQALQEVRDQAIEMALAATAKLISDNLDQGRADQMIDRAIRDLSGKLH